MLFHYCFDQLDSVLCEMEDGAEYKTVCEQQVRLEKKHVRLGWFWFFNGFVLMGFVSGSKICFFLHQKEISGDKKEISEFYLKR